MPMAKAQPIWKRLPNTVMPTSCATGLVVARVN
jgi:hypothetical protein